MILFKSLFFYIADCGALVFKENNNTLQIISSKQTNANLAIKTCLLSGGNLYDATSKTTGKNVSNFFQKTFISLGNLTNTFCLYIYICLISYMW